MATSSVEFMRHSSVQIRGGAPDYQNYLCSCNNVDGKTAGGGTRGKPAPVTPGQERLILAAFEAGLKPAAIAREFRLSRAQVDGVVAAAKECRR